MSESLTINLEELEECDDLATSDTHQGHIAQGRTIAEPMEIAQDVARKKENLLSLNRTWLYPLRLNPQ